jgi:hypothetical protein
VKDLTAKAVKDPVSSLNASLLPILYHPAATIAQSSSYYITACSRSAKASLEVEPMPRLKQLQPQWMVTDL